MKRLLTTALMAGALAISACSSVGTLPVSQDRPPAVQAAETAIKEANVLLIAAANVLGQQVVDGIAPKADAQRQLDQLRALAARVNQAQVALDAGDALVAKGLAEVATQGIVVLQREIAQRARKPQ